jgi:hypothetical protein
MYYLFKADNVIVDAKQMEAIAKALQGSIHVEVRYSNGDVKPEPRITAHDVKFVPVDADIVADVYMQLQKLREEK